MNKRLTKGVGYDLRETGDTVSLVIDGKTQQAVINYPFKVRTFTESGTLYVAVLPGTCNNFVPKISGTYLDADTAPKISVGTTGKKYVALKVTFSTLSFFPNTTEIVVLDHESDLAATNTEGYLQLASFNVTASSGTNVAGPVSQYIFSSQVAMRFKPGSGTATWIFNSR